MSGVENKDIERRVGILEDKDRYNDKRFRSIEKMQKEDRQNFQDSIEKLYDSLREIERGQHTQELTNQKMDFTLDSINKEREETKRRFNKLFWVGMSILASILGSLGWTALRMWIGL